MRKDLTDISIVLDRSGSMANLKNQVVESMNKLIAEQKTVPGEAYLTLVQFDDVIETVIDGQNLADVEPIPPDDFQPRGSTALLDALGTTIVKTRARIDALPEADRPGVVIVVVVTDGQENASREYTRDRVFGEIKHERDANGWQFVFLAANQDAVASAVSMGMQANAALNFAGGSSASYANAGRVVSASLMACRKASAVGATYNISYVSPNADDIDSNTISATPTENVV